MFGIGAAAQLARHLGAADPRDIGLIRQYQQVEQQGDVIVVFLGYTGRLRHRRQRVAGVAPFGPLNPPLDLPHRVQILLDRAPVTQPQPPLDPADALGHRIEDAAVGLHLRQPRRDAATIPEQPLEHHTGIPLVRQRSRGGAPGGRVLIGAAVAVLAVPDREVRVGGQLERPQRRVGAQDVGRVLVDCLADPDVGALGPLREHPAQPAAMRACVHAAALVRAHDTGVAEPADDHHLVAVRLERLENRGDRVPGATWAGRMKIGQEHPVRRIDEPQTRNRVRGSLGRGGQRGHHRVQERQGDGGADAPQHGPTWKRLLGHDHDSELLCKNG